MTAGLESIRTKWKSIYAHEKYGKWISNLLVAAVAFLAMNALLPFALTMDNSYLLDWIVKLNLDIETALKYGALATAVVTFIAPSLGVFAVSAVIFGAFEGVGPFLITFIVLGIMLAMPCDKVTKALTMLLPVAVIQLSTDQMTKLGLTSKLLTVELGFFVVAFIMYASEKLSKGKMGTVASITFGFIAMAFGQFGVFKGMTYPSNLWAKDKMVFAFKGDVDEYWLLHWKEILIVAIAFAVVAIVFTMIVSARRTALAKLPVDAKDAIAFAVLAVLYIAAYKVIAKEFGVENFGENYLSMVLQVIAAYIATRLIAYKAPVREKKEKKEKKELTSEEKKKRVIKWVVALVIIGGLVGGALYLYREHGDEIQNTLDMMNQGPHDMSSSEFVGTWHQMGYYDYDGSYCYESYEDYFTLKEDGSFVSVNGQGYWYVDEGKVKLFYDEGFMDAYELEENYILDSTWEPVDENGNPIEREYSCPYIRN